jgi:hypothetical protein
MVITATKLFASWTLSRPLARRTGFYRSVRFSDTFLAPKSQYRQASPWRRQKLTDVVQVMSRGIRKVPGRHVQGAQRRPVERHGHGPRAHERDCQRVGKRALLLQVNQRGGIRVLRA